jgi:hypothetical protein
MAVMKMAPEVDVTLAAALIQALPAVSRWHNLPAHMSNTINMTACLPDGRRRAVMRRKRR